MTKFNIFIIIVVIFSTILVCAIKPQMHKRIAVSTYDIAILQESTIDNQEKRIQVTNTPEQKKQNIKITNNEPNKPIERKTKVQPVQTSNIAPKIKNVKPQTYSTPKQAQVQEIKPNIPKPQAKPKRALTPEEEEIIAWNAWRSALQNEVMRDSKIRAPVGTVFRFSFTVDRDGIISNLKTWSDNSQYTPTAVRVIKPVLLSYQGQRILNFPPKSKRIITNVVGEFMTWYTSDYSSPSDYSDYERVKN